MQTAFNVQRETSKGTTVEGFSITSLDDASRFALGREWDASLPRCYWLGMNPSTAGVAAYPLTKDATARRFEHFARRLGCGSYEAWNLWPVRFTRSGDLWKALRALDALPFAEFINDDHRSAIVHNLDAMRDRLANREGPRVVAFGAEAGRRYPGEVRKAVAIFGANRPLLCLGRTPDGWPLHPLARGVHAIRNETDPTPWEMPL